jgi:hypothetical protein
MNAVFNPFQPFRFRLRTVLLALTLLAIPCAWLGSEWNVVHERAALIERVEADGGFVYYLGSCIEAPVIEMPASHREIVIKPSMQPAPISTIRRWLGDRNLERIVIQNDFPDHDEKRILDLFPQTEVRKIYPIRENRRSP